MKIYFDKPVDTVIKKRTFEGKNDDSLKSDYMPSHKYWLEITYDTGRVATATFRTKTEAEAFVARAKDLAGQLV